MTVSWLGGAALAYLVEMTTLGDATWAEIQHLRARIDEKLRDAPDVCTAAQRFTDELTQTFNTVALARMFLVTPFASLPAAEQALATALRAVPAAPSCRLRIRRCSR